MNDLSGKRALVTGASSGIGLAIARQLAARGATLVLTARRLDRLQALADQLRAAHNVSVEVIDADLGAQGGAIDVWQRATHGGTSIDILINNAGFGYFRPFVDATWQRDAELLQLNIVALAQLCRLFVDARGQNVERSYIMNIASTAAFQPVPNMASYAASKAYVRNFSEALAIELSPQNISVTCVCPGGTVTDFHAAAGAGNYGRIANASMLTADRVAELGVRAMLRGKPLIVTGTMNKIACFFVRLGPRSLVARSAMFVLGKPRTDALPERAPQPAARAKRAQG